MTTISESLTKMTVHDKTILTATTCSRTIALKLFLLPMSFIIVMVWLHFLTKRHLENILIITWILTITLPIVYFLPLSKYISHLLRSLHSVRVICLTDQTLQLKTFLTRRLSCPIHASEISKIIVYKSNVDIKLSEDVSSSQTPTPIIDMLSTIDSGQYKRIVIELHPKIAQRLNTNSWQIIVEHFHDLNALLYWARRHRIDIQVKSPFYQ